MAAMVKKVQRGRALTCQNGGYMSMYDDSENYFKGLINYIQDVDAGRF
jgi:proline iminopeptidase